MILIRYLISNQILNEGIFGSRDWLWIKNNQ